MLPFLVRRWLAGVVAMAAAVAVAAAAPPVVEEKYESGKVRGRYQTDDAGTKDGPFTEYYESGKVRAKGMYKAGKIEGARTETLPGGAVVAKAGFKAGVLDGPYTESTPTGGPRLTAVYQDGALRSFKLLAGGKTVAQQEFDGDDWRPKRRLAEVRLDLAAVADAPPPPKKGDADKLEREAALRRLMAYRAAVGVPFEGMALDDGYTAAATAGAELCQALGRLDHTPKNTVGWATEKFDLGYKGTSHGNLFMQSGGRDVVLRSVDAYMDDSDPSNIGRVGHRRWCLNPAMLKTGFGKSPDGKYSAMWSFDAGRKEVPDYDAVADPPAGFAPAAYFGPKHAWSFSPNPKKYKVPEKGVTARVYRKTDAKPAGNGTELKLDHSGASTAGFGGGPCVIFRPESFSTDDGSKYVVVIEGVTDRAGKPVTFTYLVVFVAA